MAGLCEPLGFARGASMKNRFMLAPLTNCQSHGDGSLSDDEFRWLTRRAAGGFGLTMTCAAHVQARGQGFAGQLGVFDDRHLAGLTRLAEDFVAAALRAERAGFDGVELHGAHGYVLSQFLSAEINGRGDRYGGTLENRARLLLEIAAAVRARCRPDFLLGVRLSPESFGLKLGEIRDLARQLLAGGALDLLDLSLWDVFKEPEEPDCRGRSLLSYFTELERGAVSPPVSADHLQSEGLGPAFIGYMGNWKGFVAQSSEQARQ